MLHLYFFPQLENVNWISNSEFLLQKFPKEFEQLTNGGWVTLCYSDNGLGPNNGLGHAKYGNLTLPYCQI